MAVKSYNIMKNLTNFEKFSIVLGTILAITLIWGLCVGNYNGFNGTYLR